MNLSELQQKDIVNVLDGRRLGKIIDITLSDGKIINFIIEEKRNLFNFFRINKETEVSWNQIKKIGEDVILVEITHII